jgi:alkyl sulfatase BDS1-like metallo-beta-lactamase superfamily hydrolase
VAVVSCLRLVGLANWPAFHTGMRAAAGAAAHQLYTLDSSQRFRGSYVYHHSHQDFLGMVGSSSSGGDARRHKEMRSGAEH